MFIFDLCRAQKDFDVAVSEVLNKYDAVITGGYAASHKIAQESNFKTVPAYTDIDVAISTNDSDKLSRFLYDFTVVVIQCGVAPLFEDVYKFLHDNQKKYDESFVEYLENIFNYYKKITYLDRQKSLKKIKKTIKDTLRSDSEYIVNSNSAIANITEISPTIYKIDQIEIASFYRQLVIAEEVVVPNKPGLSQLILNWSEDQNYAKNLLKQLLLFWKDYVMNMEESYYKQYILNQKIFTQMIYNINQWLGDNNDKEEISTGSLSYYKDTLLKNLDDTIVSNFIENYFEVVAKNDFTFYSIMESALNKLIMLPQFNFLNTTLTSFVLQLNTLAERSSTFRVIKDNNIESGFEYIKYYIAGFYLDELKVAYDLQKFSVSANDLEAYYNKMSLNIEKLLEIVLEQNYLLSMAKYNMLKMYRMIYEIEDNNDVRYLTANNSIFLNIVPFLNRTILAELEDKQFGTHPSVTNRIRYVGDISDMMSKLVNNSNAYEYCLNTWYDFVSENNKKKMMYVINTLEEIEKKMQDESVSNIIFSLHLKSVAIKELLFYVLLDYKVYKHIEQFLKVENKMIDNARLSIAVESLGREIVSALRFRNVNFIVNKIFIRQSLDIVSLNNLHYSFSLFWDNTNSGTEIFHCINPRTIASIQSPLIFYNYILKYITLIIKNRIHEKIDDMLYHEYLKRFKELIVKLDVLDQLTTKNSQKEYTHRIMEVVKNNIVYENDVQRFAIFTVDENAKYIESKYNGSVIPLILDEEQFLAPSLQMIFKDLSEDEVTYEEILEEMKLEEDRIFHSILIGDNGSFYCDIIEEEDLNKTIESAMFERAKNVYHITTDTLMKPLDYKAQEVVSVFSHYKSPYIAFYFLIAIFVLKKIYCDSSFSDKNALNQLLNTIFNVLFYHSQELYGIYIPKVYIKMILKRSDEYIKQLYNDEYCYENIQKINDWVLNIVETQEKILNTPQGSVRYSIVYDDIASKLLQEYMKRKKILDSLKFSDLFEKEK